MSATLTQLLAVRSQPVEGVLAYLDAVQSLPDSSQPSYFGERRLTALYVPPEVLVHPPRKRDEERRQGAEQRPMPFADDDGDGLFGTSPEKDTAQDPPRRVTWAEELSKLRHAVLLGRPGEGKTLLTQMSVRQLAAQEYAALKEYRKSVDQVTLPVYLRLADVADRAAQAARKNPLEAAFAQSIEFVLQTCEPRTRARVIASLCNRQTLTSARCYLFLDALDEVPEPTALKAALQVLSQAECRVLITSRPYTYEAGILPWPDTDLVHYTIAPFTPSQRQQFIDGWFQDDATPRERLLGVLHSSPRFNDLTSNALLLLLTCAAVERHELGARLTRGELYELITRDTLRGLWKQGNPPAATPLNPDLLLSLLAQVAFVLFQANPAGNRFRAKDWNSHCRQALSELQLKYGIDEVLERLNRCGLLVSPAPGWYAFLHRSFFEYLTAYHLAELAEQKKWPRFYEFIDKKAWDPRYQEAIVFLTGQVIDPQPLLELLGDAKKDDYFHHRLAVVTQGLPELKASVRETPAVKEWIDQITTRAFSVWWTYLQKRSADAVAHLTRALPSLGLVNGQVAGVPLLTVVCEKLGDSNEEVRWAAVWALGALGTAAATPAILAVLAERLGDANEGMRWTAVEAVRALGAAAATPAILAVLAERLGDANEGVRRAAVEVVGALGAVATDWLGDANEEVRWAAVEVVGALGAAATPAILAVLAERLGDANEEMRWAAVEAARALGAAATPAILAVLAERLGDANEEMRWAAVRTVRALGVTAATPMILAGLAERLSDAEWEVRRAAVEAVGALGAAAATPAILAVLAERLGDANEEVRRAAAWAVKAMGAAAATPTILAALAERLGDAEWEVRRAAVEAVGALGAAAATPMILTILAEWLGDAEWGVRQAAVKAVGALGAAAATPAILTALGKKLPGPGKVEADIAVLEALDVHLFESRQGRWQLRTIEELSQFTDTP